MNLHVCVYSRTICTAHWFYYWGSWTCVHTWYCVVLQKYILCFFFFFFFPPLLFSLSLSPYLDKSVSSDTPSQKSKNEVVKGTVLPKMKILSSFIYPLVSFHTCFKFIYRILKNILYLEEWWWLFFLDAIDFHYRPKTSISQNIFLCVLQNKKKNSYRFVTTWK